MSFSNPVRNAIWSIDKDQPVWKVRTMEFLLERSLGGQRFLMQLLGIFSALALLLAAMGIYGVMSYAVTRRTHELGIRAALGATGADLLRLVLKQGLTLSLAGLGVGVLTALAMARLFKDMLFGVAATDPSTFILISSIMMAVSRTAVTLPNTSSPT